MLTQHLNEVTPKRASVKSLAIAAILTIGATFTPLTAQASPDLGNIVNTKYSAKFDREMFKNEDGLQQIYLTLQKKAKKACKVGRAVDESGDIMSKTECVSDLLGQFIESANVTTLTAYHLNKEKMGG